MHSPQYMHQINGYTLAKYEVDHYEYYQERVDRLAFFGFTGGLILGIAGTYRLRRHPVSRLIGTIALAGVGGVCGLSYGVGAIYGVNFIAQHNQNIAGVLNIVGGGFHQRLLRGFDLEQGQKKALGAAYRKPSSQPMEIVLNPTQAELFARVSNETLSYINPLRLEPYSSGLAGQVLDMARKRYPDLDIPLVLEGADDTTKDGGNGNVNANRNGNQDVSNGSKDGGNSNANVTRNQDGSYENSKGNRRFNEWGDEIKK
ncbi:MAG: hypothetical protein SGCHY_003731 [Lobulomycetales sp.]